MKVNRITAVIALVLGLALFAGTAIAGNGNGNGNGNGKAPSADSTAAASANSHTPPGQEKKQDATQQQSSTTDSSSQQQSQNNGQAKKADSSSTTSSSSSNPSNASINDSQPGVKPGSGTTHQTNCGPVTGSGTSTGCAAIGSNVASKGDVSKRYGNGKTAAQIASSRGASAAGNVTIYGPGNSQPHKVVTCGHKHAVDVHAVKSYSSTNCQASTTPTGTTTQSTTTMQTGTTQTVTTGSGVLGAQATLTQPKTHQAGGVLGAATRVAGTTLPFTGLQLWMAVLVAALLVAAGYVIRRSTRGTSAL